MKNNKQIQDIFSRYLENRCAPGEVEELIKYFHSDDRQLLHQLVAAELEKTEAPAETDNDIQPLLDEVYARLHSQIKPAQKIATKKIWPRIASAAAILLFLSAGGYFVLNKRAAQQTVTRVAPKITPGTNKAILTLANGRQIILSDAKNGNLAEQGGTSINKNKEGEIVYRAPQTSNAAPTAGEVAFNTIATPRGGQYQVILPDNSHVWLNAASSIKFPTAFNGNTREVTITGEAYFEVAKNKNMPFIVSANHTQVEVLGTHFNINAYTDESAIKTTLLEGKVKVSKGTSSAFLNPGQQSVIQLTDAQIFVKETDVDEAVAWKNGYFVFDKENIETIMRKISRWYNVDVVYQGNVNKKTFAGTISRFDNISNILETLELTGSIHFKVDERRITVMP